MANNNQNIKVLQTALLEKLPSTRVREQELLCHHTTFKIGGPADLFIEPTTMAELSFTLRTIHELDVPVTIIGCGSYMLKDASEFAWQNSLSGLEFAIGIPGTLGGAVFMNAGAYDGEMSHVVTAVRAVDFQGNIKEYDASHLDFTYRHSVFHDNHEVIGEVIMTLKPGDKDAIKARMDELTEKRESKQPLEYASAGSTFKRPPGYFAGTLIEQTGLKGLSVGDAQVSHKHAGFVINTGSASAKDVLDLISEVQRRVYDQHGVHLEPEVRMIGED